MNILKIAVVLGCMGVGTGCSSDNPSSSGAGTGKSGSNASAGAGGAAPTSGSPAGSCDPVAFAMLNAANSSAKVCAATSSCITSKCDSSATTCAGVNYAKGDYTGGTCEKYYGCVKTCNCDKACVDKCDPDSLDCASCISSTMGMGCTMKCMTEVASCGNK